jgi:hypothetical protein
MDAALFAGILAFAGRLRMASALASLVSVVRAGVAFAVLSAGVAFAVMIAVRSGIDQFSAQICLYRFIRVSRCSRARDTSPV